MDYLYPVVVAERKRIAADDVLVIVILNIHQIAGLAARLGRQLDAHLNIHALIPAKR